MGVKLLGKIKIHEIAKEIGLTSKEIIEKAKELGIEAKTHMSGVEEQEAEKIKSAFQKIEKKLESKKEETKTSSIININTASLEELTTLKGIGEKKAQKIIEYRTKTPFKTKEQIMEVSGIGESLYNKIKDKVKLLSF